MNRVQDDSVPTISIGEAAKELGISVMTVRRWSDAGKLTFERSPSGQRRYKLSDLKGFKPRTVDGDRITINYARVSSHDQKEDLIRQVQILESYSSANGWQFETIQDLGSGLNYQKKGLQKLLKRICSGEIDRLVLTHKDRLLRFGSEIVFALCEEFETEVVIVNKSNAEVNFEQELVEDVLEIITVFSARLYGKRSNKNKRLIDGMAKVANEVK